MGSVNGEIKGKFMIGNIISLLCLGIGIIALIQPFYLIPIEFSVVITISTVLSIVFLNSLLSGRTKFLDFVLTVMSLCIGLYLLANYKKIVFSQTGILTGLDVIIGLIAILIILEGTRRMDGKIVAIITSIFLIYALFGNFLPGLLYHRGFSVSRIVSQSYMPGIGIYGLPLSVLLRYVFLFMILGQVLKASGVIDFLTELGQTVTSNSIGGMAKVAVISSAAMGMVSGSAVANVASTGSITIPAMKKSGFPAHIAGAIEASASTGGQIMPPIMGAAAFLMADFLGIPYLEIIVAAILPAFLYFTGIYISVHLTACKLNLSQGDISFNSRFVKVIKILKEGWYLLVPLVGLIVLLVIGYSATMSGVISIGLTVLVSFFGSKPIKPRVMIRSLIEVGKQFTNITLISACAGIILSMVSLTGLGVNLSVALIDWSGGYLFVLLILSAISAIILGLGLPTQVIYIIMSTLLAPALINMNVPILAAHFFIFLMGVYSMITPPVAMASLASSSIAESNFNKTSLASLKIALPSIIFAFGIVYNPNLLLGIESFSLLIIVNIVNSVVGVIGLSVGIEGYWEKHLLITQRLLIVIVALVAFFYPWYLIRSIATLIILGILLRKTLGKQRLKTIDSSPL